MFAAHTFIQAGGIFKLFDWDILRDGMTPRRGSVSFSRASTGTFIDPSTGFLASAAINAGRIESDGLLIEPQRTNLAKHHNPNDATVWAGLVNVTRAINTIIAPDGTMTAPTITETVASGTHFVLHSSSLAIAPAVDYVVSLYVRALNTRNVFVASEYDTLKNATMAAATNAVVGGTGTTGATSASAPASWRRVYYKAQSIFDSTKSGRTFVGLTTASSVASTFSYPSYAGDTGQSASFWGVQVELGSEPSSVILSNGAAATRSADVCTLTIPVGVSSLIITYGDNTTTTQAVTSGGTYVLPASVKKYKSISSQ